MRMCVCVHAEKNVQLSGEIYFSKGSIESEPEKNEKEECNECRGKVKRTSNGYDR